MSEEPKCFNCMDTGIMRCSNPDHGFISALSFTDMGRLGCPGCDGTGKMAVDEECDECEVNEQAIQEKQG